MNVPERACGPETQDADGIRTLHHDYAYSMVYNRVNQTGTITCSITFFQFLIYLEKKTKQKQKKPTDHRLRHNLVASVELL